MADIDVVPRQTAAFYVQAVLSFAVSLTATAVGIFYLPANGWIRGFLILGVLYVVTSSFTLAKCIRDQRESSQVVHRVDEARLERFLAEHNPFKSDL
ncbi:MAG TPA: YiaA/YiaB family inner membrane protein [Acidimicrobiales bacterium]|jgi:hypothetical protein|nr:YiaA/YiaB family inner membrane protein [Acidimicrobiales bacterium]